MKPAPLVPCPTCGVAAGQACVTTHAWLDKPAGTPRAPHTVRAIRAEAPSGRTLHDDLTHAGGACYLSLIAHAESLIREIWTRDGEGNTIPEHIYYPLVNAIERLKTRPSNAPAPRETPVFCHFCGTMRPLPGTTRCVTCTAMGRGLTGRPCVDCGFLAAEKGSTRCAGCASARQP